MRETRSDHGCAPGSPKSHHYVPSGYLARFTDSKGFLHICDRTRKQIRRQRPKKVMKIDSYYRQTWAPVGIDVNVFETTLGQGLEARAPAIFDRLAFSKEPLTEDEAIDLLIYLDLQRIRVPRQAATGVGLMRSAIISSLPDDTLTELLSGRMQLSMKNSARFDYMRLAIGKIHPWLARMEWEVIAAEPGSAFLTSDSPVCFYNPKIPPPAEAGVGLAGTIVFFPICSSHLLLMRHPECRTLDPLVLLPDPPSEDRQISLHRGVVWSASTVANTNYKIAALAGDLVVAESIEVLRTSGWDVSGISR